MLEATGKNIQHEIKGLQNKLSLTLTQKRGLMAELVNTIVDYDCVVNSTFFLNANRSQLRAGPKGR